MIDLATLAAPAWLALPRDARLQVRPITMQRLWQVQSLSGLPLLDGFDEGELSPGDVLRLVDAFADTFVSDWDGVGDAEGAPLPFAREMLDVLLGEPDMLQAFLGQMMQRLQAWGAAKNGSGPGRDGNSPSVRASAPNGAPAAQAGRPPAKPARGGSTPRKAKPNKRSTG